MKRIIIAVISVIIMLTFCSCGESKELLSKESIKNICEMSTIESYYHNVAILDKKKDNIFQKDRKLWVEYDGVANIGIDIDEVKIDISGSVVTVSMPKAKLLSTSIVKESLNKNSFICSDDSWLIHNKLTAEDQEKAIKSAQENMKKEVLKNKSLFNSADERAKELVENYINCIGEVTNREYQINWK